MEGASSSKPALKRGAERESRRSTDSASPTHKRKKLNNEHSAEQVLDDFRQCFITDVDADAIIYELKHQDIITDGDLTRIRKIDSMTQKNQDLHKCLKGKCTKEALLKVCGILIDYEGNAKMNALGQEMKQRLDNDTDTDTAQTVVRSKRSVSSEESSLVCVSSEFDVEEDERRYVIRALQQAEYRELRPSNVMKDLYLGTYMRILHILERNKQCWISMARSARASIQLKRNTGDKNSIPDGLNVAQLLEELHVPMMWEDTDLLLKIVNCLPKEEKLLATKLLQRYESYLLFYNRASKLKDFLEEGTTTDEEIKAQVSLEITSARDLDEITRMDCKDMVVLLVYEAYKIPLGKISANGIRSGNSTTITFLINKAFMQNIIQYTAEKNALWAYQELRVTRVRIPGLFELNVSQLLAQHFKVALRSGLIGNMDFVRATKALPYQVYALVDPDTAKQLQYRTVHCEIMQPWSEQEEAVDDSADNEGVELTLDIIEGKLPPKVKEEGNRVEEKEAGSNELLSHVQELEDELKRSEQKRFDLTNDITALQIKLKASREEEGQILQEMTSLKERLLLMLRKQMDQPPSPHTSVSQPIHPLPSPSEPVVQSTVLELTAQAQQMENLESEISALQKKLTQQTEKYNHDMEMIAQSRPTSDPISNTLLKAASKGYQFVVQLLVKRFVNVEGKDGRTPLLLAVERGHSDLVRKLVEYSEGDIFHIMKNSQNALHLAAYRGHLPVLQYLCPMFGDRVLDRDGNGETCLDIARRLRRQPIVEFITENYPQLEWNDVADRNSEQTARRDGPPKRAHHHRWWLKVVAKDQNTAILPSSTMELAEGSILMDGIVEFRTDPKTKLVKAVSSTEWMHRGRALKKGRQGAVTAFQLHQFNYYHQRWLADFVHEEEEESCEQWLLHQSAEMTTVRVAEEYRPGRVRYRYTTKMGLPAEVQSEKSDNSGTRLETEDGSSHQLLSMVSELEKGRKDLERKVANLFMDNVSLVKKLKASRALEAEQMKGIGNLEEQLVQALKTQNAKAKELSLITTEKSRLENRIRMLETAANTEPIADTDVEMKELPKGLLTEVPGPLPDTVQAEQVLDDFQQHFITDVDADAIIFDLKYHGIISDGDLKSIRKIDSATQQNQLLHFCLTQTCTKEALLKVCGILVDCKGNPKMNSLGQGMKQRLAKDPTPSPPTVVTTGTNAVCPALPEPLQLARSRAYQSYQRLSLTEGSRKVQFTKVAVLESAPKARKKGDPNQGEFLQRYRDYGVQLSDGATEEVTVDDFLRAGTQQNRILHGQPGTGKTTFLKHLCQKVANNEPSDFSLVLYFPLRDKAVSQALMKDNSEEGLDQLLRYYIPGKKCSASAEALLDSEGVNVLIIFDGADETRGLIASPNGSLLAALLQGRLLPQAHFIVSTRPGACPLLQEPSSLFYEILGFDEEAVKSYVKEFFKSEPGKGEAMLSDLRARPDLMGGAYIPINLQIFCSIYDHGVAGRSVFPATMTECYKSFIAKTVTQEKKKQQKATRIDPSLANLPQDVEQLLFNLGVLAFKGLTQEPPDYIFQEDEVRRVFHATVKHDEILEDSFFGGLLHLRPDQDGSSSTLNFSHTTKQEFFGAYHLSMLPKAEQAAFWRKNRHNPKFAVVLRYFAGLTQFKSAEVSKAILATGSDLPAKCDSDNPHLLYVFHALFESQNESLTQSIVTQLNSCLTFHLYLTPFDTMVLSHCLTKCKHLTELDMLPPTSFHHVCSVVQCNPLLQSLSLSHVEQFSTEDARALCKAAGSLKRLIMTVREYCTSEALAEVFDHRPLEELDLTLYKAVHIHLGDCSVLEKKVAHCQLKRLKLCGYDSLLYPALSGVKDNRSITDLDVTNWPLSGETSSAVATCVQTMPQLRTLRIVLPNPLPVLQSLSCRGSPLDSITMENPLWWELSEENWAQLKETASDAKVVKVKVNVKGVYKFDSNYARASRALAAGFSKNPLLTEVELVVPEELVESARGTLCTNTALTVKVSDRFLSK